MTHALRRIICGALIGVVLFAQLAVAAYACAGLAPSDAAAQPASSAAVSAELVAPGDVMVDMPGMPGMSGMAAGDRPAGCDWMIASLDTAAPNLCAEHCRHGQQSDQTATITVPVAVLTSLYTVPAVPEASRSAGSCDTAHTAPAAAATPLAILHCRFRN